MMKRQLIVFLIVGTLTVLIDFVSYRGLIIFEIMELNMAKATGFIIGTLFAYFANRIWTFGAVTHIPGTAVRFTVLYACTLFSNVLINQVILEIFSEGIAFIQVAFLIATGVSASLNFLGMKLFVFKSKPAMEAQ